MRAAIAVVVVVVAALGVLLLTGLQQGACYDSGTDPAASVCTTGPVVGGAGPVILWMLWGIVACLCGVWVWRGRVSR